MEKFNKKLLLAGLLFLIIFIYPININAIDWDLKIEIPTQLEGYMEVKGNSTMDCMWYVYNRDTQAWTGEDGNIHGGDTFQFLFLLETAYGLHNYSLYFNTSVSEYIWKNGTYFLDHGNHERIIISSNLDFEVQGWLGNGTIVNPYRIENLTIDTDKTHCITIMNTDRYFIVKNCILSGGSASGIVLSGVINGQFENNMIDSLIGVSSGGPLEPIYNTSFISNNFISQWAMDLMFGENVLIKNNIINFKYYDGSTGVRGIYLIETDNYQVLNNSIIDFRYGIILQEAQNILLVNNTLDNNETNAIDYGGSNNQWDDGIAFGNLYSDYKSGKNYTISGSTESIDNFPRKADIIPPIISSPDDFVLDYENYRNITWIITEPHIESYKVFRNDSLLSFHEDSNIVTVLVSELSVGIYEFMIVVEDTCGNIANDTVIVIIIDSVSPIITPALDIIYEKGTNGNIILWNILEPNPDSYNITRNGVLVSNGNNYNSTLLYSVDGLDVGAYFYILTLTDLYGNSAIDSVTVLVVEISNTTTIDTIIITNNTVFVIDLILYIEMIISGCVAVVIVALIIVLKRK